VKWVALVIVLAAIIPLSQWLRHNPRESPKIWTLVGFLPFVMSTFHSTMAIDSWAGWSGYVKGIEFTVLDALALALYFSLPAARHSLPFRFSMALYLVAVLLSMLQALMPMAVLFYCWQIARTFLVYAIVTRASADPRVVPALLTGMGAGIIMEAGDAIWQRFGLGILRTDGTFIHPNALGLASHFVVFPFFALLLAGRCGWLPLAVVLAGVVVEVLTTSRGTLGLAGFGYAAVFMLSAVRQWAARKGMILLVGATTIAAFTPLVVQSFEDRFIQNGGTSSLTDEYDERATYKKAAAMMVSDHPLGVGANHFSAIANIEGYYAKAGVGLYFEALYGNVHNVYWLVLAETGYPGLIAYLLLLLQPLIVAFLCGWRNRGDQRGDLLLGLGVALLVVYIHSNFEWIFITGQAQYIFALDVGLVAGLAQQLGYWGRHFPRGVQLGAGTLSIRQQETHGGIRS
jgi:O-antigen ligase